MILFFLNFDFRVEINADIKIRLLRYYCLRVVQESETTSKLYFCTDNAMTYHGEDEQWLEIDNSLIPGVEMLQKKYPEFIGEIRYTKSYLSLIFSSV